jgi:hypothetical protein
MDRGSFRPNKWSKCLFEDRPEIWLPSAKNLRVRHTKDSLPYKIWIIRVYSDVFWVDECTCLLHVSYEQGIYGIPRQICGSLH